MKIRFFLVGLLLWVVSAQAQQDKFLQKFYLGSLYSGSNQDIYSFCTQSNVGLRLGVEARFGNINIRAINTIDKSFGMVWYRQQIGAIQFNAGYMPRPITCLNRPHPVTWGAQFEPPSLAVIPGSRPGMMTKINFLGKSDIYFGIYSSQSDTLEYNFALDQKIDWFVFKSIKLAGYYGEHKTINGQGVGGFAANLTVKKASVLYFANRLYSMDETQSLNLCSDLAIKKLPDIYLSLVKRNNVWQSAGAGIYKMLAEKIAFININYLLCAGYSFPENQPRTWNIFFQTWIDFDRDRK